MALKVWLPLNGTLENKGLDNITFSNVTPAYAANGKIGNALNIYATPQITVTIPSLVNAQQFSFSFWYKPQSNSNNTTNWQLVFALADKNTSNTTGRLRIESSYGSNVNTYVISIHNNTSYGIASAGYILNSEWNTWHHIAFTCDGVKCRGYCDGVLKKEENFLGGTLTGTGYIGSPSANSGADGLMNDLRIYNHCLSAAEVKKISRGLMLHYKLDDVYSINTTNQLGSKSDHFSGWGSYGFGSHGQTTIANITPALSGEVGMVINKDNGNYDGEIATGISGYNLSKNESLTFSAYVKGNENTIGKTGYIWIYKSNGTNTISTGTSFVFTSEWQRVKHTITWSYDNPGTSATSCYVRCNRAQNESFYISNCQLESGKIATAFTNGTREDGAITDSSGYNHNGTITGNLQIISNSSHYSNCTYSANGGSNYIQTPTLSMPTDAITFNIWFKSNNSSPTANYHMVVDSVGDGAGRQHYELAVYKTGYFRGGLFVNGTRYADNCSTTTGCDGNWHMLTLTYDGTVIKRYFDGIMEKSTNVTKTTGLQPTATLRLFKDGYSTYACIESSLSDFRIYCTALDAEAISQLYKLGAKVDNKQNVHAFEFIENNSTIQITKQGQLKCAEINELTAAQFKQNNNINAAEFIEY